MMEKLLTVCFLCCLSCLTYAGTETVLPLPELIRPSRMAVKGDVLYVLQSNVKIVTFSLQDGRKLNSFGKSGQGPGEFAMLPGNIRVHGDRVFVGNEHQAAHFSLDGRFIAQYKPPTTGVLQPLGDSFYMASGWRPKGKSVIISQLLLLNDRMKKIKVIRQSETPIARKQGGIMVVTGRDGSLSFRSPGPVSLAPPGERHWASDGQSLVLAETKDAETRFEWLDSTGQRVTDFALTIPVVTVDEKIRQRLYEEKKRQYSEFKTRYKEWEKEYRKLEFTYPETLPPVDRMVVADGLIYLRTHVVKDGRAEFWVVDGKGGVLGRRLLPRVDQWGINQNRFFFLVENTEEDQWELHHLPILD